MNARRIIMPKYTSNELPYFYKDVIFKHLNEESSVKMNSIDEEVILELQNELRSYNMLLRSSFQKIFSFIIQQLKHDQNLDEFTLGLFETILDEYNFQWREETPKIEGIISKINKIKLSKDDIEQISSIISRRIKLTEFILSKELSLDRLEILFNHIRNAPFYLDVYLELDKYTEINTEQIATVFIDNFNYQPEKSSFSYTSKESTRYIIGV